jgi:hypothetical protein
LRRAVLLGLLALAGCSDTRAGVAIEARPGAVSVAPSLTGNIGGLTVAVRG